MTRPPRSSRRFAFGAQDAISSSQLASVFPPPHAHVRLQDASVSACVDTDASYGTLETARVAPTDAAKGPCHCDEFCETDARNGGQGRDQETAQACRQSDPIVAFLYELPGRCFWWHMLSNQSALQTTIEGAVEGASSTDNIIYKMQVSPTP